MSSSTRPSISLLKQVDARNASIQSMTLTVQMMISTGGSVQGVVKEYTTLNGWIIVGKPQDIRVILKVPLMGSDGLDMVSDGKTFKMKITFPTKTAPLSGPMWSPTAHRRGLQPASRRNP